MTGADTALEPRPTNRPHVDARVALALAVVAGALIALQARVNGSLAEHSGSATATALVSFSVGTVALLALVLANPRARAAATSRPQLPVRWWYFVGGLGGAYLVAVSARAVPQIGVAMLGVCVVAGSTAGALGVDRLGIGPGGRRHLTGARLLGAAIAVVAVVVSALGRSGGDAKPALYAAVAAAGVGVSIQQAVNGRVSQVTGEATVAALVSFLVGTAALAVLVLATGALEGVDWPSSPVLYLGGLGGASYLLFSAATVAVLGVLRLALATIAGQMVFGVAVDALAPAHDGGLRAATVAGAALTLVAVAVASRTR